MQPTELTQQIIGAAIAVHRELGPGFLESVYEAALCIALDDAGLRFERQLVVPIRYRERDIGEHRLDLMVEGTVIVELKAVTEFCDIHFATLRSYLKAADKEVGLLLNFASTAVTIKRVGREWYSRTDFRDQT